MAPTTQADELVRLLADLPRRDYANVIREVNAKRRSAIEAQEGDATPGAGIGKDQFARWIGRQHHLVDPGICRVFYLPHGAPPKEVRLLEVNDLAILPDIGPIPALDFLLDLEGIDYRLLVADVTPIQFESLLKGDLAPPRGWSMEGIEEIAPPVP